MNFDDEYFKYLSKRSFLGLIYRKFFLYKKISKYLDGTCLDYGCGIGDMLNFRPHTIGIDINKENVAYCRSLGLQCYPIENGRAPFADESFDSILLDNVLEHLEIPSIVINEAERLCKKDGIFVIGVPGVKGFSADPDHKRLYNENSLIEILKSGGFKAELFFYTPLFKSDFLSRNLKQYCIYVVAKKIGNN
jgi:SAM-dependent methyltransferase